VLLLVVILVALLLLLLLGLLLASPPSSCPADAGMSSSVGVLYDGSRLTTTFPCSHNVLWRQCSSVCCLSRAALSQRCTKGAALLTEVQMQRWWFSMKLLCLLSLCTRLLLLLSCRHGCVVWLRGLQRCGLPAGVLA